MTNQRVLATAIAVTLGAVGVLVLRNGPVGAQAPSNAPAVQPPSDGRSFSAPWFRNLPALQPATSPVAAPLAPPPPPASAATAVAPQATEEPVTAAPPVPLPVVVRPPVKPAAAAKPAVVSAPAAAVARAPADPTALASVAPPPVAAASAAPKVDQWSPAEIQVAKARCTALLKGLDAVVVPQESIKKGACGAPAPMQLVSLGKTPQVAFSPPPTLTCDMIASLGQWLKEGVQPAAKQHLGSQVVRVDVMSDYSCRGIYGRARARLSEHGRANALDIRGFVTASASQAMVLADWGPTAREIKAQIAVAKAEADRAAAARAIVLSKPQQPTTAAPSAPGLATALKPAIDTIVTNTPSVRLPGARPAEVSTGLGLSGPGRQASQPNWLGGPKPVAGKAAVVVVTDPAVLAQKRSHFLRDVHGAACRIFGTTLGPEADAQHRNHFHVDMAQRQAGSYCE